MLIARSACSCGLLFRVTEGSKKAGLWGIVPWGEGEGNSPDSEDVSPRASEPDSASLLKEVGGQPPRDGEACHRWGSNGHKHPSGLPGCLGRARVERSVEEPGRPGVVSFDNVCRESITCMAAAAGSRSGP